MLILKVPAIEYNVLVVKTVELKSSSLFTFKILYKYRL
jgi:hypothetical protein